MPQFEFRFLVCAFLPSVPLSLILLLPFYQPLSQNEGVVYVALLVATAGIFGLIIDGARHLLEEIPPIGKGKYISPETTPQELRDIRKEVEEQEVGGKVDESVFQFYSSRWTGYFHVYEFYSNFALSTLIGLTLLAFFGNTFSLKTGLTDKADMLVPLLMTLVPFCIGFSVYYCYRKRQELNKTFDIKDKKINWNLPIILCVFWVIILLGFLLDTYPAEKILKTGEPFVLIVAITSSIAFVMLVIYLEHKERMAIVEKRVQLGKFYSPSPRELQIMLNRRLVVLLIGASFLLLYLAFQFTKWFAVPGLILLSTALAFIVGYCLTRAEIKRIQKEIKTKGREEMRVRAYVLINTAIGKAREVATKIRPTEGVKSADSVTGPYDVIVQIEADNYEALMKLVPEKIHTVEGITKTVTCIAAS